LGANSAPSCAAGCVTNKGRTPRADFKFDKVLTTVPKPSLLEHPAGWFGT
jgi:hypothetical protein